MTTSPDDRTVISGDEESIRAKGAIGHKSKELDSLKWRVRELDKKDQK